MDSERTESTERYKERMLGLRKIKRKEFRTQKDMKGC